MNTTARKQLNIIGKARDRHPYLKRFENDWATADLVKQFLRNRRKYLVKREKNCRDIGNPASFRDGDGDGGDKEGDGGDEEGVLKEPQGIESD
jgi:hypothetical protein